MNNNEPNSSEQQPSQPKYSPAERRAALMRLISKKSEITLLDGTVVNGHVRSLLVCAIKAIDDLTVAVQTGHPGAESAMYEATLQILMMFEFCAAKPMAKKAGKLKAWPTVYYADSEQRRETAQFLEKLSLGKQATPKTRVKGSSRPYVSLARQAFDFVSKTVSVPAFHRHGQLYQGKRVYSAEEQKLENTYNELRAAIRHGEEPIKRDGKVTGWVKLSKSKVRERWWDAARLYFAAHHPRMTSRKGFAIDRREHGQYVSIYIMGRIQEAFIGLWQKASQS